MSAFPIRYRLVRITRACPEQYYVYRPDVPTPVGYMRLRHGTFRVDHYRTAAEYGGHAGVTVYTAAPEGDGAFRDDERARYLGRGLAALDAAVRGVEPPAPDYDVEDPFTAPEEDELP